VYNVEVRGRAQREGESAKLYILWRQYRTFVFIQRKSCIEKHTEKQSQATKVIDVVVRCVPINYQAKLLADRSTICSTGRVNDLAII